MIFVIIIRLTQTALEILMQINVAPYVDRKRFFSLAFALIDLSFYAYSDL